MMLKNRNKVRGDELLEPEKDKKTKKELEMERKQGIQEHLMGHKDRGLTIKEIAEALSMFPSEAEEAVKELHEKGAVSVKWLEGEMYVIFLQNVNLNDEYDPMIA